MPSDDLRARLTQYLPPLIFVNFLIIFAYVVIWVNVKLISVEKLEYVLPALLLATLFGIIIGFALKFKTIIQQFSKINRNTWVCLLLIILLGAYLRVYVVPHTHRIFFDEDIYIDVGNGIASEGRALLCNYGTPDKCTDGILNKEPNGFPVLIGILYFLFGRSEQIIFAFSTLTGILTVGIVFLTAYLVFDDEHAAAYTSLLYALMPAHIIWSGSVGAELFSILFILLTVASFKVYFRTDSISIQALAALVLVYAIQIRPENGMLLGVVGLMFLVYDKKLSTHLKDPVFYIPWIVVFVLITPHLIHLTHAARTDTWGASDGKLGLKYVEYNLPINTSFFYDNNMHPAFFTLLAFAGLFLLLRYDIRSALLIGLWFLAYYILYIVFYSGSFTSGGIGTRFALIVSTPILFFAGYALAKAVRFSGSRYGKIIASILIVLVLVSFYPLLQFIRTPDMQAQYAREMHDFVLSHLDEIDPSCYMLTHNPNIFLVNDRSALQTWFGQNNKVMRDIFSETDCMMFLEGAWCLWEPHKSGVCKSMHNRYNLTLKWRLVRQDNPNQVFTIYNVQSPF